MMKKQALTTLVLIGAMLLLSTPTMASVLPAQDGRMWAPTGDLIGLDNHATATVESWDPHGNKPKYAEDWQRTDDVIFEGLFGYYKVLDSGRSILVRGYGDSNPGSLATRITAVTNSATGYRLTFDFRNFENSYDVTSEMRVRSFGAPPAPPALAETPQLNWRKGKITFDYDLGGGFGFDLGFNRMCKIDNKGSLLRGSTGDAVPNLKTFDTTTNEFLLGVNYGGTSLDVGAYGVFRQTDGDRAVGDHLYKDDQTYYRAGLDATYRLGSSTSLLGAASTGKLKTENTESYSSNTYNPNGEAKTTNGRLAVISHLGRATTARLTAGVGTWKTDYQTTNLAGAIEQATARERTSTDIGFLVTNTSLSKTRLRFDYRFKAAKLEDNVTEAAGDNQIIDQDRQSHRANLRVGIRLGRKTTLKARFGWQSLSVDQTNTGDDIFYTMGDRKQDRYSARLALQTRPSNKVRLNLGIKGHDQSFEREDIEDVKTTNRASQAFLGFNYMASNRLTFVLTSSYGLEKYEIKDGPTAATGMGPLTYEGTTIRFAPGVILQLTKKMEFEAHYEGVRFEDPGDYPDEGNQLNSDLDRILLRAGYRLGESMKVSATYRRHEFDENRWDDYIMDLYSLSLSGKF